MPFDRIDFAQLIERAQAIDELEEAIAEVARSLPADAGSILDFFEIPTGSSFDVAPEKAIGFFQAKKLKPTFSYADMMDKAHDHAFTVAKMMDVDMLAQVRASLDSAVANGQQFKDWADSITPILQSGGWWGRKAVVDPLSGQEIVAQLGSPARLETIFRTNMQSSYAAGAWQEIDAQKDIAPYLMYDSIDDFRTRELHRAWDRTVLPVSSPWWSTHYPPNGYNCRCGVIQLSEDELESLGLTPNSSPPDAGTYPWKNPRTGEVRQVPKGVDPSFTHNSGQSYQKTLKKVLKEKAAQLPDDMQIAMAKAKADATALSESVIKAAAAAQAEVAKAAGKAALARAKALAEEKSKQFVAAQELQAIANGKDTAGKGAAYKIKALQTLKKDEAWPDLSASDQLKLVLAQADEYKLKTETASKLATYKKAILEGKTPAPGTVKAFESLSPADQTKLLEKIDAEKAAIQAKQAAEAAEAAKKAAGAEPSSAAQAPEPPPPNPATMTLIGRKTKGGTEGGLYQDTATGQKYMVKFNGSEDAVLNEVLAGRLYNLAGVEAPELHYITIGGRPALASRIVDGIVEVDAETLARTASVQEGFTVDAWLANWDSIGLNYDNTVLIGGRALRIDVGGSLRYRALGGLKGNAFGRSVGEIDSLRDGTNPQARAVFANATQEQLERGAEKVLRVSDADIRAAVEKYGPRDAAERATLADLLIARKADIEKRFPAAAQRVKATDRKPDAPPPAAERVTDAEQQFIDDSRVNGYGLATDKDQIEDHMVVVSNLTRADGTQATRGWLKLRADAVKKLMADIGSVATGPSVNLQQARDLIFGAVKSVNHRAAKGEPLQAAKIGDIKHALNFGEIALRELKEAAAKATRNTDGLQSQIDIFTEWTAKLRTAANTVPGTTPAKLEGTFEVNKIPATIDYDVQGSEATSRLAWRKITGTYQFETAKFDRSNATETGVKASAGGVRLRYEATLPDGTTITFFPAGYDVAFAMQGAVKIDTPGRGKAQTERIMKSLGEMGVNNDRPTTLDRQHLYLNAFARLRLVTKTSTTELRSKFAAIGSDEAGLKEKLQLLRAATGTDVTKTEGWTSIDGVRQAFGHGRAHQLRPDLSAAEMNDLGKELVVYHNPAGLSLDAGAGVFEKLKPVLEGGGTMASLVDRIRRGVPLSGSSVESDLDSGGGDYFFTRIRQRAEQKGTGVYFKTNLLRRMDAISYASDKYGRTTETHIEDNRLGQNMDSFRSLSRSQSNETIFKNGASLFDGLDRIVLSSADEVKQAIDWMKAKGYKVWPDGRKLEEVILTKAKHNANT